MADNQEISATKAADAITRDLWFCEHESKNSVDVVRQDATADNEIVVSFKGKLFLVTVTPYEG